MFLEDVPGFHQIQKIYVSAQKSISHSCLFSSSLAGCQHLVHPLQAEGSPGGQGIKSPRPKDNGNLPKWAASRICLCRHRTKTKCQLSFQLYWKSQTFQWSGRTALPFNEHVGFSRQEYWSGLLCPSPGDLPDPGIEPVSLTSPALVGTFFTTSITWEPSFMRKYTYCKLIG